MFFPILVPKTLPKWRPKSTKINEQVVPTGLSKNVPHFDDLFLLFLFFVKRVMATKHCKYQYKTTFFASCQNPLKLLVGDFKNEAPRNDPKNNQQKSQKCRKSMILGTPNFGEITGVEQTFRHFFGFGRLWGSPGAQNGPKTSAKPSQDPSKPRLLVILDRFSDDFDIFWEFFRLFFVCIFACVWVVVCNAPRNTERRTQNAAGTVAGMARRAVGYWMGLLGLSWRVYAGRDSGA